MKEQAGNIFAAAQEVLSSEQLESAAQDLVAALGPAAEQSAEAVYAVVGGALASAGELLPEVTDAIGVALAGIAANLPYIGVAAGCLGAIVATFKASKDDDANVKTVLLWSASVKDWLLIVAERVCASKAESTMPLFKGLQEQLLAMATQMEK